MTAASYNISLSQAVLGRIRELLGPESMVNRVVRQKLTYLDRPALAWLRQEVSRVEEAKIAGTLIETGCALGGSAIVIAEAKAPERRLELYDVFGLIPAPSERDGVDVHNRYDVIQSGKSKGISGDEYYGYRSDLMAEVRESFRRNQIDPDKNNVHLIKGMYQDTLHPKQPIALAHIDCDWYDSVACCLERIVPRVAMGGSIILDDYFSYSGCRAAVWDFFRHRMDEFAFLYGPRLLLRRIQEPATAPVD